MSSFFVRVLVAALTLSVIFGLRWFFGPLVSTSADMPLARELRAEGRAMPENMLDHYNKAALNARTARCPDRDEPPEGRLKVMTDDGPLLLDLHPERRTLCPAGCVNGEYNRKERPCYRFGPRSLEVLRQMSLIIKRRQAGVPDQGVKSP